MSLLRHVKNMHESEKVRDHVSDLAIYQKLKLIEKMKKRFMYKYVVAKI